MDDCKEQLKAAFGDSSDSEEEYDNHCNGDQTNGDGPSEPIFLQNHDRPSSWEHVKEINGLWLCRNLLSPQQQSSLLSSVLNEGWFTEDSHNQAMRFGDLPAWATELSDSIREAVVLSSAGVSDYRQVCVMPSDLLWREPLFDQLIVNLYQPGEGICAHVDLMRFEDGIAIVSLESSCVMHFTQVGDTNEAVRPSIGVHLNPGSLVLMSGEARYFWKHEINRKPGFQMLDDKEIDQKRRISITLRKLRQNE